MLVNKLIMLKPWLVLFPFLFGSQSIGSSQRMFRKDSDICYFIFIGFILTIWTAVAIFHTM